MASETIHLAKSERDHEGVRNGRTGLGLPVPVKMLETVLLAK